MINITRFVCKYNIQLFEYTTVFKNSPQYKDFYDFYVSAFQTF